MTKMLNIHWFRCDLRLKDNRALSEATKEENTLCIFIIDENLIQNVKYKKRLEFLFHSLKSLKYDLQMLNSDLLILKYNSKKETLSDIFLKLHDLSHFNKLYFNRDYTPFAVERDQKLELQLTKSDIGINTYKDYVIFEKDEITKEDKSAFKVFTAYKTQWLKNLKLNLNEIKKYDLVKNNLVSKSLINELQIPDKYLYDLDKYCEEYKNKISDSFPASESEARTKLTNFFADKIHSYKQNRDFLDLINENSISGTSNFSPYLKFGLISVREIVRECAKELGEDFDNFRLLNQQENKKGSESFLSEIIWREFYKSIQYFFPKSLRNNFQIKFDKIKWKNDIQLFQSWCDGMTGYPIVDAAMRQLNTIGWMHNRARMIVASFLCKDLHIDWKWGERYFFERLIDYDLASNVGGWQWTAGTGTDAAPYFRIFNPIEQGKKFDPSGEYVRKYIPELKNLPTKFIHSPWELTANELEFYKIKLGKDYPAPIVDHKKARDITMNMYGEV